MEWTAEKHLKSINLEHYEHSFIMMVFLNLNWKTTELYHLTIEFIGILIITETLNCQNVFHLHIGTVIISCQTIP